MQNCSAQNSPSGNLYLDASGIYVDSLVSQLGCDSLVIIDFTRLTSSTNNIIISSCYPQLAPSGNFTMSTSGTFTDSLLNYLNCDSIITIHFTLIPINYMLNVNSDSLWVAYTFPATYQWLNCTDNSPVAGAVNASFQPSATGDFAVVVNNGICSDTSVCFPFNVLGTNELSDNQFEIKVYPNPTTKLMNIHLTSPASIHIFSSDGKWIATLSDAKFYTYNVETLENGIYFIRSEKGFVTKFYKQ
jgi:hypothetical protein